MWVHARRRGVGGPAGPAGGRLGVDAWCSVEGDLNENDNFKEGNPSCLVTTFCVGAILAKMAIREM